MQSGINLRGIWLEVSEDILSVQGRLSDHVLECIREGKALDMHTAPSQTINYYFAQSVFISLRAHVRGCQSSAELSTQLQELISAQNLERLIEEFISAAETKLMIADAQKTKQQITKEFLLKQIKTDTVESFLRLYYALEQAACEASQLNALSNKKQSFTPADFAEAVKGQMRNCKDLLKHLTKDILFEQQQMNVDPIVEFNNHVVRMLEEKKVCQIVLQDLLTLPMNASVNQDVSLVRKHPEIAQIAGLQEIGEMLAALSKNQAPGAEWEQAKASYVAALRVLESEMKDKVLLQSNRDAATYQEALARMLQQKVDIANTQMLDAFGERLTQFYRMTDVSTLTQLAEDLSHHCKALQREASVVGRLSAKLDELTSKLPGKRTSQKEPAIDVVIKSIEQVLSQADAAKKPYDDILEQFDIFKTLRQAQDLLPAAEELSRNWQVANEQFAFIVNTAIQKLREMSVRLQDVEKQQPNMVLDFLKRRWPEMTISFGSVGTAGGFGTALLSIFGIFSMPVVVTVAVVVVASAATGVIVGAVKDIVTQPKTEKEIAMASLDNLANGDVQIVEQPPAAPAAEGLFARFFGRATPPPAAIPMVVTNLSNAGK